MMIRSVAVIGTMVLVAGCGLDAVSPCKEISTGGWQPFGDPYGDGSVNPAAGARGTVTACPTGSGATFKLAVNGLVANRMYGAHVHVLPCTEGAGGHYRHQAEAGAVQTNEVWLDVMTDANGQGTASAVTDWPVPKGKAMSVVIHDHMTGEGGAAGPKLTCVNLSY